MTTPSQWSESRFFETGGPERDLMAQPNGMVVDSYDRPPSDTGELYHYEWTFTPQG